ncbi:MAG: beta-fructosidase [Cyanobacteria bacterium J06588_5]
MNLSPSIAQDSPRWDPWILTEDSGYRLFYLGGRTDQDPWWKTSWICGARSQDARHWQHTGPVLEPLANEGWESGRIFAGSTYKSTDKEGSRYYLFYSAASKQDIANEAIGLATSTDTQHWQRSNSPLLSWENALGIQSPSGVGYAGRCNWAGHLHWRDPYVVKSTENNRYYLFFCTSLTHAERYQGGLGIAVADAIDGPYQLLPPAAGPGISTARLPTDPNFIKDSQTWPFYHLERPQIIFFQGRYHLFFSCFKDFINPLWLAKIGAERVSDSTLYWYVAEQITGPFLPISDLPVVPGSESTGLYGTTFFPLSLGGDWSRVEQVDLLAAERFEMTVLGWYYREYRLAIAQEFSAIWTKQGLRIVANDAGSLK